MPPRALIPALAAVAVALAAYAPTSPPGAFSDAVWIVHGIGQQEAPSHYHVAFFPLARIFRAVGGALFGWSDELSLVWFSRTCGALAAGVVAWSLGRRGRPGVLAAAGGLLVALSPGPWLFANVAEVHALQLLGAALGLESARLARGATGWRAWALLLVGSAAVVGSHLTGVVLLPTLVWIARGPCDWRGRAGAGREGIGRAARAAAGLSTLALLLVLALRHLDGLRDALFDSVPGQVLSEVARMWIEQVAAGQFFPPGEVARFLRDEWILPAGLLTPLAVLALTDRSTRPAALVASLTTVPYVLLFPQLGVREAGAYFLPLLPLYAFAGIHWLERRTRPLGAWGLLVIAALLIGQTALAMTHTRSLRAISNDIPAWVVAIEARCPADSRIVVSKLPEWHALSLSEVGYQSFDLWRDCELVPPAFRDGVLDHRLGQLTQDLATGRPIYIVPELVDGPDPRGVTTQFRARLEALPITLSAQRGADGETLVYRLEIDAQRLATDPDR